MNKRGVKVTQATVSRDIKELRLLKALAANGRYKYATVEYAERGMKERFVRILSEAVLSVDNAENLVVIKTIAAGAAAACEAIDSLKWPEVMGTIAGENTLLIITRTREAAESFITRLAPLIKK